MYEINFYRDKNGREPVKEYLLEITNQKISEIIIDSLFKDTYYNVVLNIKEMLRYNQTLKNHL